MTGDINVRETKKYYRLIQVTTGRVLASGYHLPSMKGKITRIVNSWYNRDNAKKPSDYIICEYKIVATPQKEYHYIDKQFFEATGLTKELYT